MKAVARVRKKNIQAKRYFVCTLNLKLSTEKLELELSTKKVFHLRESGRCFLYANVAKQGQAYSATAAKFASPGNAHKRTNTQIKSLYYPLNDQFNFLTIKEICCGVIINLVNGLFQKKSKQAELKKWNF